MLVVAPAAQAADPIMPLSEVRAGMHCTALSVVRGTTISPFDVEVLDTIAPEAGINGPRILIRVSGAAVATTGVGPGFSGSPIYCDGRNIGAISEGVGDYGNFVVLATPIEEILSETPAPTPPGARPAGRLARLARPLVGPLTASGLSTHSRKLLSEAAHDAGRTLLAAPAGPLGGYPQQELRPGAAVAAGLVSGDVSFGAVGTVAYRDGNRLWAFGHPLDELGPRALFMQDSYVFSIIGNPLGIPDAAETYKLTAAGGHTQGAFTTDASSAIVGNLGAEPPSIPLHVVAHGHGRTAVLDAKLADERTFGLGAGLALIAPLAAETAIQQTLHSLEPARVDTCMRFVVRGRKKPLGFCNTYASADASLVDISRAGALVEGFDLPTLPITGVELKLNARTGLPRDVIIAATPPRRVRAGARISVRLELRRRGNGDAHAISVPMRVPRSLPPGIRTLVVEGSNESSLGDLADELLQSFELLFDVGEGGREPRNLKKLAAKLHALHQPEGIIARFRGRKDQLVRGSSAVVYDGRVRVPVQVLKPRR
jgi:hypothetical protein